MIPRGHALTATLALASILIACGDAGTPGRAALESLPAFCQEVLPRVDAFLADFSTPSGERYGGTAVAGSIGEMPNGMNAFVSSTVTNNQHQTFVNLMPLVRVDENLQPHPWLAESWEFNEDGTEVTFHLRDDVYWHDGTQTSAYDVEFTYRRAIDPQTAFPNASFWNYYDQGPDGVQVLDSLTVRLRMEPHSEPLDPWRSTAIMPRHLLEDVPPSELAQHPYGSRCPVGNGPFVFESHRTDESWSFVRNPAFPEALGGPPYLERYVYRIIPEQTTLLAELLTENIDFYVAPGPDQVPQIEADPEVDLHVFPYPGYDMVIWNTRRPQLSDARVRQAIAIGTNRQEIVDAIRSGYGEIANSGVPPFHWAYAPALADSLQYDPDRARALLDQAGWTDRDDDGIRENADGDPLEIDIKYNLGNQQREDIAQIMQAQLAPLGIRARPQVVEWATLLDQINTPDVRDFDAVVIGWRVEFRLDDHEMLHSSSADDPFGWPGIQDPDLDRLLDRLQLVTDREEATPLWREYQYRLLETQPVMYLYFIDRLAGVNQRLRGVELDIRGEWASIQDWWIPAEER